MTVLDFRCTANIYANVHIHPFVDGSTPYEGYDGVIHGIPQKFDDWHIVHMNALAGGKFYIRVNEPKKKESVLWDVTVSRYGVVKVDANSAEEAKRIVDVEIPSTRIVWDNEWAITACDASEDYE